MNETDTPDLHPSPDDDDTRTVINDAVENLGVLRDLYPLPGDHPDHDRWITSRDDPALRLHLLASLQQALNAELLNTAVDAHERGYDTTQIAVFADPTT